MGSTKGMCGGCPATWTGFNTCHCSGCHRTFAGVRGFDDHRKRSQCVDPATLGYAEDEGVWKSAQENNFRKV